MSPFIRYLLVGGASFALEYGLFQLLYGSGTPWLMAHTLTYVSVFVLNFLANRVFTFRSSGAWRRQLLLYLALLLVNTAASSAVMFLLVRGLQWSPTLAKPLVMLMVVGWNFQLYRRVIYR